VAKEIETFQTAPILQSCPTKRVAKDPRHVVVGTERFMGSKMANEDVSKSGLRTSVAKIVDERVGNVVQERQEERSSGLRLLYGDLTVTPVDVIEAELADVTRAHPVASGYQQNRVVAPADRRGPVDRLKHSGDLVV
jgi:hypothetical protein